MAVAPISFKRKNPFSFVGMQDDPSIFASPGALGGPTAAPPPPPDYASILSGDPFYNQLQKDLMAQSVADAASLKSARQRALIQFGEVPNFTGLDQGVIGGNFDSLLTPDITELIRQNTSSGLSTVARLADADTKARLGIRNALNARGTYNSGETGYQLGNEAKDYLRAQSDARNNLVNALAGYNSQFLASERQRQALLSDAALQAFLRGDYGSSGGGGGGSGEPPPGVLPTEPISFVGDVRPLPPIKRPVGVGGWFKAQ